MRRLLSALVLPAKITAFERQYLERMNRIGIRFFVLHLPVLVALAWLNDTDPLLAAGLCGAVIAIPIAVARSFDNPRTTSVVFGFTAMLMGGLLVHFGQGPMQIEMHFYFFVLIALLAVFANPMAILVAAATVAVHHLILWLALPESVFNYEAPVWVVAVHAGFVVLESIAACFIARSFFDNVIGLEQIVALRTAQLDARTRDMRLVLDNVEQGFLTLHRDGTIAPEHSAVLRGWLGEPRDGESFAAYLGRADEVVGETFALGWQELLDDVLPEALVIAQLPARLKAGDRELRIRYAPIRSDGMLARTLVVITDVTAELARERLESEQRDAARVLERIVADKAGFVEFHEEASSIVRDLASGKIETHTEQVRALHTLKGNAAIFGALGIVELCHALESALIEDHRRLEAGEAAELARRWERVTANVQWLIGDALARTLQISEPQYQEAIQAIQRGASHQELARLLRAWKLEPTSARLGRMADHARSLALRLGKGEIDVSIAHNDVRLEPAALAELWSALMHVVRNAVDHGIEGRDERDRSGKQATGSLHLGTRTDGDGQLSISIRDDGRGVDWKRLAARAEAAGMPAGTEQELIEALFADGISTSSTVSEISGRGVGMSVVRSVARRLGGDVVVQSRPGEGTEIRVSVPLGTSEAFAVEVPTRRSARLRMEARNS